MQVTNRTMLFLQTRSTSRCIFLSPQDGNDKHRLMSIMPEHGYFAYVSDLYLETGSLSLKDIHDISKIKEFNSPTY